ncbi:MAG TPA: hypothetical protein VLV18_05500 [Terriglobales bacterium]|nr:hypothetical protein [Terriglobales bacterium]
MSTERANSFVNSANKLVQEAQNRNVELRVMGAVAFRIHCPQFIRLVDAMNRELTDLDFMGYKKQRSDIIKMFKELSYTLDKEMLILAERLKFHSPSNGPDIDVFLDELRMCHTILFKDRLELDSPTIPLTDLLLEKMQIVQINEKDIKDTIVLLREHAIGTGEPETIDTNYLCKLLANDWGFYYTVTTNLKKLLEFLPTYSSLSDTDCKDVASKVELLLAKLDSTPKSAKWKFRASVGTKRKWYEDVEEGVRE